jgi:hypothetical protein
MTELKRKYERYWRGLVQTSRLARENMSVTGKTPETLDAPGETPDSNSQGHSTLKFVAFLV